MSQDSTTLPSGIVVTDHPPQCEWHRCQWSADTYRTDIGGSTFALCQFHADEGKARGYWRADAPNAPLPSSPEVPSARAIAEALRTAAYDAERQEHNWEAGQGIYLVRSAPPRAIGGYVLWYSPDHTLHLKFTPDQARALAPRCREDNVMTNYCDCKWTTANGADLRGTIGDALPGLDPCAGHRAAIERAYQNGRKDWLSGFAATPIETMLRKP